MPNIEVASRNDGTNQSKKVVTGTNISASNKTALDALGYGLTSAGTPLPLKVVDDGSGYGKLSVTFE